jgi:hypothetical protein
VGLHYESKARFRSRVLLVVGQPIAVAALLPDYRRDPRETALRLTAEIRQRLDEVVLQAETRELLLGIARVASFTASGPAEGRSATSSGGAPDLAAQHRRARELVAVYGQVRERDPARVEAISAAARAYARTLRRLGVSNPWALELEMIRPRQIAAAALRLLVSLPLALLGAVMGWVPYRLAGIVARHLTDDDDLLGTIKLMAGAAFLLAAWLAEAVVVGLLIAPLWGAVAFLAAIGCGYVALRFEEIVAETREAGRTLWMRAWHFDTARRLADRRRQLAEEVTRALREA